MVLLKSGEIDFILKVGFPFDDNSIVRIDPEYADVSPLQGDAKLQVITQLDQIYPLKELSLLIDEKVNEKEVLELISSERFLNLNVLYTLKEMKFVLSTTVNSNIEIMPIIADRDSITEIITFESIEDWKEKWSDFLNKKKWGKRLEKTIRHLEQELDMNKKGLEDFCLRLEKKLRICENWEKFFARVIGSCSLYDDEKKNKIMEQVKSQVDRYQSLSKRKDKIELRSGKKMHFLEIGNELRKILSQTQTVAETEKDISTALRGVIEEIKKVLNNVCTSKDSI